MTTHAAYVRCLIDDRVRCEPFTFVVTEERGTAYVQARLWRADADTGVEGWGLGPRHPVGSSANDPDGQPDYIVKRCLVAALSFAEHEVREAFLYDGRRVFGPHMKLSALWEAAV